MGFETQNGQVVFSHSENLFLWFPLCASCPQTKQHRQPWDLVSNSKLSTLFHLTFFGNTVTLSTEKQLSLGSEHFELSGDCRHLLSLLKMNLQPEVKVEICSPSYTVLIARIIQFYLQRSTTRWTLYDWRGLEPPLKLWARSPPNKIWEYWAVHTRFSARKKACQKENTTVIQGDDFSSTLKNLKPETPTFCFSVGPSLITASHISLFIQKGFKILLYTSYFKPSGLDSEIERVR